MGFSQFEAAELDGAGSVTVSGPMHFAPQEQDQTFVSAVNFVLVQGNVFVPGSGSVRGVGRWGGTAEGADLLKAGEPAVGYGVALLVRRHQEATAETQERPPTVQILAWSEIVKIS